MCPRVHLQTELAIRQKESLEARMNTRNKASSTNKKSSKVVQDKDNFKSRQELINRVRGEHGKGQKIDFNRKGQFQKAQNSLVNTHFGADFGPV